MGWLQEGVDPAKVMLRVSQTSDSSLQAAIVPWLDHALGTERGTLDFSLERPLVKDHLAKGVLENSCRGGRHFTRLGGFISSE